MGVGWVPGGSNRIGRHLPRNIPHSVIGHRREHTLQNYRSLQELEISDSLLEELSRNLSSKVCNSDDLPSDLKVKITSDTNRCWNREKTLFHNSTFQFPISFQKNCYWPQFVKMMSASPFWILVILAAYGGCDAYKLYKDKLQNEILPVSDALLIIPRAHVA